MGGFNWGDVAGLLIFVLVIVVIFLVFREVICWYWKINQEADLLKWQGAILTEIRDLLAAKGSSQVGLVQAMQQTRLCTGCGATVDDSGSVFCTKCGAKL